MLCLNQSYDETRTIKVLVVPIGTNSLFDQHFQVVSKLRDVPFYELNRPSSSTSLSPFKHFNWHDGNLLFEFHRYDRVLIGPGDLNNFQSSKRILMIMGLINYPELGETVDRIEEEMEYFARRHPNILLRRLFVFNYSFDDPMAHNMMAPLLAKVKDRSSLVIFPPDGQCGANNNSSGSVDQSSVDPTFQEPNQETVSVSMVDVHLKEVMSHAALHVVLALEQQMRVCEDARSRSVLPEGLPMSCLFDDMEESGSSGTPTPRDFLSSGTNSSNLVKSSSTRKPTQAQYKKKPSGRIHKWMGDLCMQACSPRDALEHFAHAITECRALNETLWLAGALDGYASAVLLLIQRNANIEEILSKELKNVSTSTSSSVDAATLLPQQESMLEKAYRLVEDKANEAVAIYASNIVFCGMEVECLLRLARMLETCPFSVNKEPRVMEYVQRAVTVPGLNAQQQVEVTLEGGLRCHRLGLWRKYALFLFIAALMSADNENYGVAHALMCYACKECGIASYDVGHTPMQIAEAPPKGNLGAISPGKLSAAGRKGLGSKDESPAAPKMVWASLRATLYSTATLIADEQGDALSATHYLVGLMRLIQDSELRHAKEREQWQQVSPRRLLSSEGTLPHTPKQARSNSRSMAPPLDVRWDGEHSAPPRQPVVATSLSFEAPMIDHTPAHRRSRTADADISHSVGVAMRDASDANAKPLTPVLHRSQSPMVSRKLGVAENASSFGSDTDRDLVRYRPQTGNISAADTADVSVPVEAKLSGVGVGGARRLMVPSMPERLHALTNLTQLPSPSCQPQLSTELNSIAESSSRTGEFLLDRLIRSLSVQDSGQGSGGQVLTTQLFDRSMLIGGREDTGALAVDALEAMADVLAVSRYPPELQEETYGLFARLSKSIVPNSKVALPIAMHVLRPLELVGGARPVLLSCTALATAKRNFAQLKERICGESSGSVESADGGNSSSSLFYDPFAAKRQKQRDQAQKSEVLWAVQQESRMVAVLSNPLCVPVFLTSLFPVLRGAEHTVYPVSIHIPPNVSYFEVELTVLPRSVGVLEVQGLQFVINNATHLLAVGRTGCAELTRNETQGKSPSVSVGVATNIITVVQAGRPLQLCTSLDDSVVVQVHRGDLESVDCTRTLVLSPGELKQETLSLCAKNLACFDDKCAESEESHFRVLCRQYSSSSTSKLASCMLRDFSGPLCASEQNSPLPQQASCVLLHETHNPHPRAVSFTAASRAGSFSESVLASLILAIRHDPQVRMLEVEIEVCTAPPAVFQTIEMLKCSAGLALTSLSDAEVSLAASDSDALNLYSRCYCLRVCIQHQPSLHLRSLTLMEASITLPVPEYEGSALLVGLERVLRGCVAMRNDSAVRKAGRKADLVVKYLPRNLDILMEVANESDWWGAVMCADKKPAIGDLVWKKDSSGEQRVQVLDEAAVSSCVGPLLRLPPHSLRTIMLRFATHNADEGAEDSVSSLTWTLADQSSYSALSHSSDCRCGDLMCLNEGQPQLLSLHRRSPKLSAILRGIPAVTVTTRVVSCSNLGSECKDAVPVYRDSRRGDLYSVSVGRFADVFTDLHAAVRDTKIQVEVAVIVVANDVPVLVSDNSGNSSSSCYPSSALAATADTQRQFLLTGKPYARYTLLETAGSGTLQHRVRICFPHPGSFTFYCTVRELGDSPATGPTGVEEWWSSAGSYVRLVAQHNVE